MDKKMRIVLKTEFGDRIGMGHLVESLHLASELKRMGAVLSLAIRRYGTDKNVPRAIASENYSLFGEDDTWDAEYDWITGRVEPRGVVVFNQKNLDKDLVKRLRQQHIRTVCITEGKDSGLCDRAVDIVAEPSYMILSPLIQRFQKRDVRKKADTVVLCLGGSDPRNNTEKILKALSALTDTVRIHAVVGYLYRSNESLERAAARTKEGVSIHRDVPQETFFKLLGDADLGISSGGDTLYEMAALGLPTVTICPSQHQVPAATRFHEAGATIFLGLSATVDGQKIREEVQSLLGSYEKRRAMSVNAQILVDGRGAARAAKVILQERG